MAGSLGNWLDEYERTARLVPGLLAVAPAIVLVLAAGIRSDPVIIGLISLVGAIGMPVAMANLVRQRGVQLELQLWAKWVGFATGSPKVSPTVLLLRVAGGTDPIKEARRQDLAAAARVQLPSALDEQQDPAGSDQRYEAAIQKLITKTRERSRVQQFQLVFKEVQGYGFWRNLLGLRPIGRTAASVSLLVLGLGWTAQATLGWHLGLHNLDVGLGEAVILLGLLYWIWVPSEAAVRRASTAYAERLLQAAAEVKE